MMCGRVWGGGVYGIVHGGLSVPPITDFPHTNHTEEGAWTGLPGLTLCRRWLRLACLSTFKLG